MNRELTIGSVWASYIDMAIYGGTDKIIIKRVVTTDRAAENRYSGIYVVYADIGGVEHVLSVDSFRSIFHRLPG